jgi:hypothetical protein
MSSTQSFLRQRVVGTTTLAVPSSPGSNLYVFVAGAGNYVGNYPGTTGFVVTATTAGVTFPSTITNAVLRDMGKTIKAVVSNSTSSISSTSATPGYFREVQLLLPSTAATGTTFGVGYGSVGAGNLPGLLPAGNAGDDGYGTFYLPIVVGGVVASDATGANPLTNAAAVNVQLGNVL